MAQIAVVCHWRDVFSVSGKQILKINLISCWLLIYFAESERNYSQNVRNFYYETAAAVYNSRTQNVNFQIKFLFLFLPLTQAFYCKFSLKHIYKKYGIISFLFLGNTGKPLDSVEGYDWESNTWSKLPNMPTSHCSCAYITFNGKLHIIGGLSMKGPSNAMEALGSQ